MTRLGRLFALIAALGGFAAAHAVTQSGQAMELPTITNVTTVLPTLPPPPTTTAPPPLPPPPTTTLPLPVPVPPPPLPLPPLPTVTTAPVLPAPLPPSQTWTLPRVPAPAPVADGASGPAPTPTPSTSSGSTGTDAAAARGRATTVSTARSLRLRAMERRTERRVSVRLTFTLPRPGRIFLVGRGPAPACRVAGVVPVRGRQGANTVYFVGRVHGRRLEPGYYLISLSSTRRADADAPAALVHVASRTRSVPAPGSAPRPACNTAETPQGTAPRIPVREAPRTADPPTARPAVPLRPPIHDGTAEVDDDSAGFLPIPESLDPDTGAEAFAAIAILTFVGALLLAMLALVTRLVRGSWSP